MHALCRGRYSIQVTQASSAKFAKMNKSPECCLPLHILKYQQVSPRPLRLCSTDVEDSRSKKEQFDHLRHQRLLSQEPGNKVSQSRGGTSQMVKGSSVGPEATGLFAGKGGRKKKNYSVSVFSACILYPLKQVPYFVQVQSIAIVSFGPLSEHRMQLSAPPYPISYGTSPDKNKDFQPTSN